MFVYLSDWTMRRLLSINRDAAKHFEAPNDGRKWSISAWCYAGALEGDKDAQEKVDWIDWCFWPGHCKEAWENTIENRPLEIKTFRAKRGAFRVVLFGWWALLTGNFP